MLVGIFSSPDKKNLARKSPWLSRFPHPVSLPFITLDNVIYSVIRSTPRSLSPLERNIGFWTQA